MTVQDDMDFLNFLHKRDLDVKDAIIADKDKEIAEMKARLDKSEARMAELEAMVKTLAASK